MCPFPLTSSSSSHWQSLIHDNGLASPCPPPLPLYPFSLDLFMQNNQTNISLPAISSSDTTHPFYTHNANDQIRLGVITSSIYSCQAVWSFKTCAPQEAIWGSRYKDDGVSEEQWRFVIKELLNLLEEGQRAEAWLSCKCPAQEEHTKAKHREDWKKKSETFLSFQLALWLLD